MVDELFCVQPGFRDESDIACRIERPVQSARVWGVQSSERSQSSGTPVISHGERMRLVAISEDRLDPPFGWLTLGPPLLKAITSRENTDLISSPPLRWAERNEWTRNIRRLRGADILFWLQWSSRPSLPVWLIGVAAPRARRVAYICDPWKPSLSKIGMLASLQKFDPCFVGYREAYHELTLHFPKGRFEWLPTGVDTDTFRPRGETRRIFAYWMGRRYEPLHKALLRYCLDRGLDYRYSRLEDMPKFGESAELTSRAQYFVVTPPNLDNPVRTGGFSPLVMRYLEGLAAGARLLGVLPQSGEYERLLLPRDAILEVSPNGEDLATKLDADVASGGNPEAVKRACDLVRSHHSWAKRGEQIYTRLINDCATPFDAKA